MNKVQKTEIKCPYCNSSTGIYKENIMFLVIDKPIHCPKCDEVVIRGREMVY